MGHSQSKGEAGDGDSLPTFSRSEIPGTTSIDSSRGYTTELVSSDGQMNRSDAASVELTGSLHQMYHSPPRLASWLSGSLERKHKGFGDAAHMSDMSPSDNTPAESAQKVGESILIKREYPLNPVLHSKLNKPLEISGSFDENTHLLKSIDLDAMISRLLDAGYSSKFTKSVCLKNAEISAICSASQQLLLSQPVLLDLLSPVQIVGDIHGQYTDLIRLFGMCGFPHASNYLFLGNYVHDGKQSLETILLLLCYKLKYPEHFFLLRGSHECAKTTREVGFYEECKRRCNLKIWKTFIETFNCLPIAAVVSGKIFCAHGGLSPRLWHIDEIRKIARPTDVPDFGLLRDLLWSSPADMDEDWKPNERGMSFTFGNKVTKDFLQRHDFDLICRGHLMVDEGYEFFQDRMLVTLFSAPRYREEFDNWGAIMSVSDTLTCRFERMKPLDATALRRQIKKERNKRNSILNSPDYRHDQSDLVSNTDDDLNEMLESDFEQGASKGAPFNQVPTTETSKTMLSNVSRATDDKASLPELPDNSQLGLASDLFKAILSLFITIAQRAVKTEHSRRLRSELERLFLWGDAISISNGQLHEVFSESPDVRQTVISTLYELGNVINDNILRAFSRTTQSEESDGSAEFILTDLAQSDMAQQLQKLLKKAAPVWGAPENTAEIGSLSDDETMRYDLDEILDDVAIYIDCLMDLSLALEKPVVDIEPFGLQGAV